MGEIVPEILASHTPGGKTLPEIQFRLLHGGGKCARNSGRLLHGVQNLARDLVWTFARVAKPCLRFGLDFCTGCKTFPEIQGRLLQGGKRFLALAKEIFGYSEDFNYLCSMITFPIAKINLGLNVVEKRPDGYHNLETVFYPVRIKDALEVFEMAPDFPSPVDCDLKVTNIRIEGDEHKNLVVRAYNLLKQDFPTLPRVHAHLYKGIPTQAGMGGGSSDCGYMITLLNEMFRLGLSEQQMIDYAARLGADCAFFISSRPTYAEGIGEKLQPIDLDLSGWYIAIVRPAIPVPTKEAFSLIHPHHPAKNCRDIVMQPVETWRGELVNDFEQSVFSLHPEIGAIKDRLYEMGAAYAAMSGSGSSLFGLFHQPVTLDAEGTFKTCLPL